MSEMPEELHGRALRRIAEIRRQQRQLEQGMRDAIVAARAVGTPVTRIAEVAETSRDTIYRWLRAARRIQAARERRTAGSARQTGCNGTRGGEVPMR